MKKISFGNFFPNSKMKNKFLMFGMGILILAALAGSTNAQVTQTSRASGIPLLAFLGNWQWFVVNALIIFAILFVVQAALITEKIGKEKGVAWVLALAIALVASWFISSSGFIWQHPKLAPLFNLKVVVNTLVITLGVYVLLGLHPKFKMPDSTPGKIGMGILIGLIALMVALKIGDAYIWNVESIRAFIAYLFGPQGILTLNQYRVAVFITSSAIFAWLFAFLGVSKEQPAINYILAIILGASLASGPDPVTMEGIVTFGHIVGTIVLGKNLADQVSGKWKIAAYAGAFFLLWWAINATSPGHGLGGSIGELWFGKAAKPGEPLKTPEEGPGAFTTLLLLAIYIVVFIVAFNFVKRLLTGTTETETGQPTLEEAQPEGAAKKTAQPKEETQQPEQPEAQSDEAESATPAAYPPNEDEDFEDIQDEIREGEG